MNYDDEILLTTILRRVLVANDEVAILADVRGLQRKVMGLSLNPYDISMSGNAASRHDVLDRALAQRKEAQTLFGLWEQASKAMLSNLAKSRGGHPPDSYTFRNSVGRTDTPTEVAELHTKRIVWEINHIIRRNAELHVEKAKLEDRVAYLEAALANVTKKGAA